MTKMNIPKHIAIILDGNRRWARERGLPTIEGHRKGVQRAKEIVIAASDLGIKYMTIYLFSKENWERSVEEVTGIMKLFDHYIKSAGKEFIEKNIKVDFIGNLSKLSDKLLKRVKELIKDSSNNSGMNLVVALSYGGREEIVDAAKKIAEEYKQGKCTLDDVTEDFFQKHLYKGDVPYPDLLIRPGREFRISNFLVWQLAYTEFYFTKPYFPDFSVDELKKAINEFNNRKRRYGQ